MSIFEHLQIIRSIALIHRGETSFINEPYVTGGNPILSSKDGVMFNDMLGSSLNIGGKAVKMTAFGESSDTEAMYTGKHYIGELGYAFLFRNYRAELGKWQTADPLGYPDGWNNLAYVNNGTTMAIDWIGRNIRHYVDTEGGVNGSGHSAWIVGNSVSGYKVYDYGPASSDYAIRTERFQTLSAAEAFLQQGRTGTDRYDKAQEFTANAGQDAGFILVADEFITQSYNPETHNCYQLGYDGLDRNGVSVYPARGYHPNMAFRANKNSGYANLVQISE